MTKLALFEMYEKENRSASVIVIKIHTEYGGTDTIISPNIKEKMEYLNKHYDYYLKRKDSQNVYITDVRFL